MTPDLKSALVGAAVQFLLPLAFSGVLTGIVALLGFAVAHAKQSLKSEKAQHFASQLGDMLTAAIAEVRASVEPLVKEAAKDGRITPEEARAIRDAALGKLKAMLGEKGQDLVHKLLGVAQEHADTFLTGLLAAEASKLPALATASSALKVEAPVAASPSMPLAKP